MVDRISTLSYQTQDLRNINLVQTDLANLNQQISSGSKATTYQELNGVVERVSGYNTHLASIDNYTTTNTTVSNNLNSMDQSLTTIQSVASNFSSLLTANKNPATGNTSATFLQEAESLLNQVTATLNTQNSDGNYIYSGSKTNTPPVATPVPDLDTPGVADNNYYQGDNNTATVRVSDTQTINYSITAGDPAFQNLIGSIKTAIAAFQSGDTSGASSTALLSKATDMLNSSVSGMASLQAKVGVNETTVNTANDMAATMKTYLQNSLSDDTSTDIASASIQLSTDQTVLQATYQAFASITKLNLTTYLN